MAGKAAAMGSPRLIVFGRVALCAAEALSPGASVGRELVAEAGPGRMGGALAPPRLTFESCVCTRVCVHTYALTLAQADGIHTNRSRRPGGRGVCAVCCVCAVCVCGLWVSKAGRVPRPYSTSTLKSS